MAHVEWVKCSDCGAMKVEIRHLPGFPSRAGGTDEKGNIRLDCRVCFAADYKAAAEIFQAVNAASRGGG